MTLRPRRLEWGIVWLALLAAACSATAPAPAPVVVPEAPPQVAAPVESPEPLPQRPDPVLALIAESQAHFDKGEAELRLGHLERAKAEFNRAIDILLESPDGARSSPPLREHFDRLVDRISTYEIRALAVGDGFTEQAEPPASLDELLALTTTFDLPAPKPELKEAVESDLRSTVHDIPIPLNPKVLAYVELFQGRLRDWFQAALQRGQPWIPMIQDRLRAAGLPQDLAYVPVVESAFHTTALSRAKAKGFWQLMRGTAVEQGLKHDWYIDERANPVRATEAAVKYLRLLNRMFDGDWHLTLASYNGGPGKVQRAIKRRKSDDFWVLAEKGRYLARETKQYVPMVLAAMVVARNPAQYGFTIEPAAPPAFDTVSLPAPVDLRRIAEWTGEPVDEIQRLNPELRRMTTPLRSAGFVLRVPPGTAAAVDLQLASASPEDLVALQYYTVKRGESISSIAGKLRVRRADLAEANYLSIKSRVRPGDRLVIPRAPTTLLAARTDQPAAGGTAAGTGTATRGEPTLSPRPPDEGERTKVTYRVKRGDTLFAIARMFRTTVEDLREWNGLKGSRIVPGDRLTVYTSREPGTSRP